jgi:DNA helicase-2/ATP-dependent DNA helicase PcrA
MLSVEISTIYKKGERTRKIHHLIYAPDFDVAERLVRRLAKIGNLASDGRPILGLDSRHLLELVLESGEGCYLVPAHIWTPWFSVLGSKAGFDAVDDCYGDLAPHVFALETGLSSDPAMNWRLSALDRYRLVSNSDAHSPPKLGREATAFDCALDYYALRRALETGSGFAGTVEFFPEEGKYHLDGHRKCGVRLEPAETRAAGERCPACGELVTVGVLHRVEELADRPDGARPDGASPFRNLIPLPEVLAELHGAGAASQKVQRSYDRLLARLGPELFILEQAPVEEIGRAAAPLLAEAVARMRESRVIREAGYDGENGVIRLFTDDELRRREGVSLLFADTAMQQNGDAATQRENAAVQQKAWGADAKRAPERPIVDEHGASGATLDEAPAAAAARGGAMAVELPLPFRPSEILLALDADQRAAAAITSGPLLIIAGPGTGKTRTLTHRIAHLVEDHGAAPEECLAITFTRRAAVELRERLVALLGDRGARVPAVTFHALALSILEEQAREHGAALGLRPDFRLASEAERIAVLTCGLGVSERRAKQLLDEISQRARSGVAAEAGSEPARAAAAYEEGLRARGLVDFDGLVDLAVSLLERQPAVAAAYQRRHRFLSIDEYQDIDERQYRLVRLLASDGNVCAIGDPDQAIYGFRGADVGFFFRFQEEWPSAAVVRIRRNYRSTRTILDASLQVIAPAGTIGERRIVPLHEDASRVTLHEAASERAEAEYVVHQIERMIGGSAFFSLDSGRVDGPEHGADLGFSDFAVLYRTEAQSEPLVEALARSGMPFQKRSHRRLAERAAIGAIARLLRERPSSRAVVEQLKDAGARLREEVALPAGEDGVTPGEAEIDAAVELLTRPAERAGRDLARFLSELFVDAEVDALPAPLARSPERRAGRDASLDARADRISLLTLHAAKGLEFPVVFVVGCEDGLLPLRFAPGDDVDLDEERRLFYVGMTRARQRLLLTHARTRRRRGRAEPASPSPFLRDIEERLLERQRAAPAAGGQRARQLTLF